MRKGLILGYLAFGLFCGLLATLDAIPGAPQTRWRFEGEFMNHQSLALGQRSYEAGIGVDMGVRWIRKEGTSLTPLGVLDLKRDMFCVENDYYLYPLMGGQLMGLRPYAGLGVQAGYVHMREEGGIQGEQTVDMGMFLGRVSAGVEWVTGSGLDFFSQIEYVPGVIIGSEHGVVASSKDFLVFKLGTLF